MPSHRQNWFEGLRLFAVFGADATGGERGIAAQQSRAGSFTR